MLTGTVDHSTAGFLLVSDINYIPPNVKPPGNPKGTG